jgi:GT2 family glycosyltransferase
MVSIIIPNYNGRHFLKECLESVVAAMQPTDEVIVVDNGSTDGSQGYIQDSFPQVRLIENSWNTGFSHAVNQGIRQAAGDYVFLLNNDTFIEKEAIRHLVEAIETDETVLSVNGLMLDYLRRDRLDGAGDSLTIFGWAYRRKMDYLNAGIKSQRVFSSCGGATLYRRKIFDEIGYFDEDYFAYYEDVDIGFRGNVHGYKNLLAADAVIYHHRQGTSGQGRNVFKTRLSARNSIYMVYKNLPLWMLLLNLPFLAAGHFIKYLFYARHRLNGTYWQGVREALGNLGKIQRHQRKKALKNYLWIQLQMVIATGEYGIERLFKQ